METTHNHIDRVPATVVVLNGSAGGGTAVRRWNRVRGAIRERLGQITVVTLTPSDDVSVVVRTLLASGHRRFVAAGGDGTVNVLVRSLMAAEASGRPPSLGAIGLGSSNDFHKPLRADQRIAGLSCKIDFDRTQPRDVGVLRFEQADGRWEERHWIVNASLGITADANDFFNTPNALLKLLKRCSTDAGILYAALSTIARYRSQHRWVQIASAPAARRLVTNLAVVKSPHFSGGFCYDSRPDPASGRFHVHLCEDMSLVETLHVLWSLSHSHFNGTPHTTSWITDRLLVTGGTPFAVEFDGEVVRTRKAAFSIARNRLEVCM